MTEHLDELRDYIRTDNSVSFANIMHRFPWAKGDLELQFCDSEKADNIVLWAGVSEELADCLEQFRREKSVAPMPCSPLVYLADGMSLNLPIAKSIRCYKKPHWAPVVFKRYEDVIRTIAAADETA